MGTRGHGAKRGPSSFRDFCLTVSPSCSCALPLCWEGMGQSERGMRRRLIAPPGLVVMAAVLGGVQGPLAGAAARVPGGGRHEARRARRGIAPAHRPLRGGRPLVRFARRRAAGSARLAGELRRVQRRRVARARRLGPPARLRRRARARLPRRADRRLEPPLHPAARPPATSRACSATAPTSRLSSSPIRWSPSIVWYGCACALAPAPRPRCCSTARASAPCPRWPTCRAAAPRAASTRKRHGSRSPSSPSRRTSR